ncbi:MAG: hypothetical protein IJS13_07430 [Paludibacteraceae bacterium]|nr:hypothetical protein [Paludibacteraceae bacterium]
MATTHTDYELNVISPSELKDYMTLEEMHERLVKSINDAFAKREKKYEGGN